jgi:hypothetical protein
LIYSPIGFSYVRLESLDLQAIEIAELQAKVDYLQAKVTKQRNRARKAVKLAPGHTLVKMTDVRRVKGRLRGKIIYDDEASDVDMPRAPQAFQSEAVDCIIVRNTKKTAIDCRSWSDR